jgi:putative membrane protein
MMIFGMFGGLLFFLVVVMGLGGLLGGDLFQRRLSVVTYQRPSARQIIEQRYARGEINREQYLSMLEDIR